MNYQLIPFPLNFYWVRYSSQITVNMARPTFKGYMDNIQLETGNALDDFWRIANEKGLVERGQGRFKKRAITSKKNFNN